MRGFHGSKRLAKLIHDIENGSAGTYYTIRTDKTEEYIIKCDYGWRGVEYEYYVDSYIIRKDTSGNNIRVLDCSNCIFVTKDIDDLLSFLEVIGA